MSIHSTANASPTTDHPGRMPRSGDAEYGMSSLVYQDQRDFTFNGRTERFTITAGPARYRGEDLTGELLLTVTPDNYKFRSGLRGILNYAYFEAANSAVASVICGEQGWRRSEGTISKLIPDSRYQVIVRTSSQELPAAIPVADMTAATRKQLFDTVDL